MAVSLATRLTPYMGSGSVPKVVISGHFVLGLCKRTNQLYIAPYLDMRRAFYPKEAHTLDVRVSGRHDGLSVYWQPGVGAAATYWGPTVDYPQGQDDLTDYPVFQGDLAADYPYLVSVFTAGTGANDTYCRYGSAWDFNDYANAESQFHSDYPQLGEGQDAGSTVIELTGRLQSLDLSKIKAAAVFKGPTDNYRRFVTTPYQEGAYGVSGAGGYKYTGWFLDHVDVYDQQQLRGLVTGADGKIAWH